MAKEIERKFLLRNDDWKSSVVISYELKQGYLNSTPERTVRVRIRGSKGMLTVKGKNKGISRVEFQYEVPLIDAEALLLMCEQPIIEKTRHEVLFKRHTWEIDVFEGENLGLAVAEIELESEDEVFKHPDWIGEEVSTDSRYYNASLIRHPYSKWTK